MSEFDPFARYYDADFGSHTNDIGYWRELARQADGPVLELMCGTGRVLLPLARAGITVTGVDIAPKLLSIARRRVEQAGLQEHVTLRLADVREDPLGGPFALAFVALNSFMHLLTSDDQLAALRQVHAALTDGGLLAFDLYNPDPRELIRHAGELVYDRTLTLEDGTQAQKFIAQHADAATQLNYVTFFYDELGTDGLVRRSALPFRMRWIYRYELEHLLARAGFDIEVIYGGYDLEEYNTESSHLLAVARKR
jgi:SAM-dependent methyltransferase